MDVLLSSIGSSLNDIFKYNLVSYINTGDRQQDVILNTLVVTLFTLAISLFNRKTLWMCTRKCTHEKPVKMTKQLFEEYTKYIDDNSSEFFSIGCEHDNSLIIWISENVPCSKNIMKVGTVRYSTVTNSPQVMPPIIYTSDFIKDLICNRFPIYVTNHFGIVGVVCSSGINSSTYRTEEKVDIIYNSKTALDEFMKLVNPIDENEVTKKTVPTQTHQDIYGMKQQSATPALVPLDSVCAAAPPPAMPLYIDCPNCAGALRLALA